MWKAIKEADALRAMCDALAMEMRKVCIDSCSEDYPGCKDAKFHCDHAGLRDAIEKYEARTATGKDGE